MSRSHLILTATLALGTVLLSTAGTAEAAMTITCESRNNARHTCPVKTNDGVRLSRQLSTQGCWQNDTWGYGNNEIARMLGTSRSTIAVMLHRARNRLKEEISDLAGEAS